MKSELIDLNIICQKTFNQEAINKYIMQLTPHNITEDNFESFLKQVITTDRWTELEKAKCIQALKDRLDFGEVFKTVNKKKMVEILKRGIKWAQGLVFGHFITRILDELVHLAIGV